MRLLIIDDSPTALLAMEEAALQAGMDCACVDNEAAAMRRLARQDFHGMLVDAHLQGVSGLVVARNLKERYRRLRVAIISASISSDLASRVAAEGFHMLSKPVSHEELSSCFGSSGATKGVCVDNRETVLREISLAKAGLAEAEARDEQQYWAHRIKGMAIILSEENLRELASALERAAPNSPPTLRAHLSNLLQEELERVASR